MKTDNPYQIMIDRLFAPRDSYSTSPPGPTPEQRQAKLDADKAVFFAAGGQVQPVPLGLTGEPRERLTRRERKLLLAFQGVFEPEFTASAPELFHWNQWGGA